MQIQKNVEMIDLALKIDDLLVITDLHVGYEEALNKQGVMIPRTQFDEMFKRLEKILKATKPKLVVINGDLKHEFGIISETEWRQTLKILDLISMYADKIILVQGNHDKILGPIARKRNVELVDYFVYGEIAVVHGDTIEKLPAKVKTIIIGHEHPAVNLSNNARTEKYKCFLKGKYNGKNLIVMPSFNPIVFGSDILSNRAMSPYLKQDIGNFNVYIVEDRIYDFGKLKKINNSASSGILMKL